MSDIEVEPHRCVVIAGPLGFVATCPCGWVDSIRNSDRGARAAYAALHAWEGQS